MSNNNLNRYADAVFQEKIASLGLTNNLPTGYVYKLASDRSGIDMSSLANAVYGMAKKAYLNRNEWKIIAASIDSLRDRGV